ncbi:hypothetical protein KL867_17680 [Ruegeria litorea]|uniref:Uncharacterized protein n=1 Tax=Falsiruegeria litorea TaxID=1280831 RepID=A0ABS5WWL1_9RHOB|nr:hypothetical protein [Falsiruegeria litorea]MBT3142903.1 hypothetical protein [Falsiruegeria litorea]
MSKHVVIVGPEGGAESVPSTLVQDYLKRRSERERDELARVEAVKARGVVPECCGDAIPVAPARGAFRVFEPVGLYPVGEADHVARPAGYRGRKAMQLADAFDVMEAQARKVLFTPGQKAMGRHYASLTEKLACVGARCSSLEASADRSAGGGGEYIDAVIQDRQALDRMRRRIGSGAAMKVRRIRPSERNKRGVILDLALVEAVCVQQLTISQVLFKFGWVAEGGRAQGKHISALRSALCEALDRSAGPVYIRRGLVARSGARSGGL